MVDHFDDAALAALRSSLGDQVVEMLLGKFLTQMDQKVALLRQGIEDGDLGVVRQQAHDLSSSAGSVGLGALSGAASACELAIRAGEVDALDKARKLADLAPEARAAVKAAYPDLG